MDMFNLKNNSAPQEVYYPYSNRLSPYLERKRPGRLQSRIGSSAFTLVELIVCIAIISVLASVLLPSLSAAKAKARSLLCTVNATQMTAAWTLYSYDNAGVMVPNKVGAMGYESSWLPGNAQSSITDYSIEKGPLYDYAPDPRLYRCPEDRGKIEIDGRAIPRAVSYGLSIYLNGAMMTTSTKKWLGYAAVTRVSQLQNPSATLTFIGEDPVGNAGTQFVYYPTGVNKWISFPEDHHGGGSNPAFADGHVERWSWEARKTGRWQSGMPLAVVDEADQRDLQRLQRTLPGRF